ncbi:MAG: hypothetical protein FWE22_00160 [Firmicutes bacterium]|nr:hypothetical protein [Bacillota bacterium]
MELIKPKYRIRCETGVCKNFADSTIKHSRLGIGGALNICTECLKELFELLKKEFKAVKKEDMSKEVKEEEKVKAAKKEKNIK